MNLSEISIKNPVFAWMLMIALIFFGLISFQRLGVSQMPDVDFPVITVQMALEGAAPEIMETEVVDVIEDAVMSIEGVKSVTSSARQGSANVKVEFELSRNIDVAMQEVQTKITQAQRRLPVDIDPPVIIKVNPEDQPIMWVGLSGDNKSLRELIDYAEDRVKPFLQTVAGVGDVFLGGFSDRNLRVWVDAKKLTERDLTLSDVLDAIRSQHEEIPAGRIETKEREMNVRVMGESASVADFENILIASRGGRPLYKPFRLKEVATIEDGVADVRRLARVNGKPALGLGIRKQRGSNAVAVAKGIKERLKEIEKGLAPGFQIGINFDSTKFIEDSIGELTFSLILSAILTSFVCWLFLGSLSSTMNVLLAIPTSILGSFLILYFLGFTLNSFTMLALALAIGIVVDDAIMVLENITRHREMGKSKYRAAMEGAKEIGFAAIAATIAIIAIFLPVAFMTGIIGKFFFQFGITISVAVALSLLEALTLTPMRCSQFLQLAKEGNILTRWTDRIFKRFSHFYSRSLAFSLRFRWSTLFLSFAFFGASLLALKNVRKEFIPPQDQSMFLVRLQAPVGSSLEFTDTKFKLAEAFIQKRSEVTRYFGAIGGFGGGEVDSGVLFVTMVQPKERKVTQQQFIDVVRKEFNAIPGLKAIVQDLSTGGFSAERGFPVEFSIRGPDLDKLGELTGQITKKMEEAKLYEDIDTDYRIGIPEVRILPDRTKASERGVSIRDIGEIVNAGVGGVRAGKFTRGGRRYDIRVRLTSGYRDTPEGVRVLKVRNDRGETIPLSEVVTVVQKPSLQTIQRRDRERSVGIFANLAKGVSQTTALDSATSMATSLLPEGYHLVLTGGSQTFKDSFKSLIFALVLGIAVAYMVLASQFNSFIHPFTVLLVLPFSVSGSLLALMMGNYSVNIFSLIGILLLMGLVKKNSILLVDYTNQVRSKGAAPRAALLEACPVRLRPIVMTTISTIAAAIPPALALGPGAETRIPMAVAVIGGMLVSTALSLFVVPCAYDILAPLTHDRRKEREAEE